MPDIVKSKCLKIEGLKPDKLIYLADSWVLPEMCKQEIRYNDNQQEIGYSGFLRCSSYRLWWHCLCDFS
jgi:hypothetical protein